MKMSRRFLDRLRTAWGDPFSTHGSVARLGCLGILACYTFWLFSVRSMARGSLRRHWGVALAATLGSFLLLTVNNAEVVHYPPYFILSGATLGKQELRWMVVCAQPHAAQWLLVLRRNLRPAYDPSAFHLEGLLLMLILGLTASAHDPLRQGRACPPGRHLHGSP